MEETTKRCPACSTEKPASAFNRSVRTASGLDWQCKDCKTAKLNKVAQRRRDERRKGWHAKQLRAREQARAKWGKSANYICAVLGCGSPADHLHHVNYDEPLGVVPLCAKHHNDEHMTLKAL